MTIGIDEIAPDIFRIASFEPRFGFTFNQYLVRDEEPLLYHTGFRRDFPDTRDAVARLIDPASIRWIGYSHFEPDECGALNQWLAHAPQATPIAGTVGAAVVLDDYADRKPRSLEDDEVMRTGRHQFRLLSTPHLPHGWDACLLFDETDRTLFCSDLFLHGAEAPALTESDIVGPARAMMTASLAGPFAHGLVWAPHTRELFARLCGLKPQTLALMHGSAFRGNGAQALADLGAVIHELFGRDETAA